MQAHHTAHGWLAVEWHLGVGGISLLNFLQNALLQCLQFPAWKQLLSPAGDVYGSLPGNICQCLARAHLQSLPRALASSLPGNACQFPAWERLPVPCLGTLASFLPGNACQCACPGWECLQSLPGTLASSLPGTLCQFPAWERLPMPCLGMFASPPAWERF